MGEKKIQFLKILSINARKIFQNEPPEGEDIKIEK